MEWSKWTNLWTKLVYYNVIVRWKDNQMKSADSVGADSMWA